MKTKTDKNGRTWEYNDAEGCYTRGSVTIGCGAQNKAKWMNWEDQRSEEFKTLGEAMDQLGYESDLRVIKVINGEARVDGMRFSGPTYKQDAIKHVLSIGGRFEFQG